MTQPTIGTTETAPARVEPNHLGLGELIERHFTTPSED